jgi:hypothetical protein
MRSLKKTSSIVLLLFVLACRGGEEGERSDAASDVSVPAAMGSGTLTIGETTYEFEVLHCDFAPTQGSDAPTLTARGQTNDGRGFSISVERDETSENVEFLIIGEEYFVASIMNLGGGWSDARGPVDGPLVHIEGSRLTARATFLNGTDQVVGDGSLEASCDNAS